MPRYKLTIAYEGTDFCGWQKQEPLAPNEPAPSDAGEPRGPAQIESDRPGRIALRTVQGVVERAVRETVREPVLLLGASRTDAGVHARGQVGAFTCSGDGPGADVAEETQPEQPRGLGWPLARGADRLVLAINSRLPEDVMIVAAEPAPADFDPIGHCTSKAYSYTILVSPTRPLFERRVVHHMWTPLDADLMNAAAARIVGEHDFAAFAAASHGRLTTVRTVFSCAVSETPADPGTRRIRIDVTGNGFLYNMVRIIAGTLVEVGRGRMTPDDVARALESKDRRNAGPTLPPTGLCLEWVKYEGAQAHAR